MHLVIETKTENQFGIVEGFHLVEDFKVVMTAAGPCSYGGDRFDPYRGIFHNHGVTIKSPTGVLLAHYSADDCIPLLPLERKWKGHATDAFIRTTRLDDQLIKVKALEYQTGLIRTFLMFRPKDIDIPSADDLYSYISNSSAYLREMEEVSSRVPISPEVTVTVENDNTVALTIKNEVTTVTDVEYLILEDKEGTVTQRTVRGYHLSVDANKFEVIGLLPSEEKGRVKIVSHEGYNRRHH